MSEKLLGKILAKLGSTSVGSVAKDTLVNGLEVVTDIFESINNVVTNITDEFDEHVVQPVIAGLPSISDIVDEFDEHVVQPVISGLPTINDIEFAVSWVPTIEDISDFITENLVTLLIEGKADLIDEFMSTLWSTFDSGDG